MPNNIPHMHCLLKISLDPLMVLEQGLVLPVALGIITRNLITKRACTHVYGHNTTYHKIYAHLK